MQRPSPRQRFVLNALSGVALAAALVVFFAIALAPGDAATGQLLSGFEARSYAPGDVAALRINGGSIRRVTLRLFLAGAVRAHGPNVAGNGWDKNTFGAPVGKQRTLERPGSGAWIAHISLGAKWPSGDYVARLTWRGGSDYAPFVLRPKRLGTAPVLVIEPTNTWHAYNAYRGDSWYLDPSVHRIDLRNPFADHDVKGRPVPAGLPKQFKELDVGFLRWYWKSGYRADFFSDDDLERIKSVKQLLRYKLIVFGGHEEYVTSHVYKLITAYRDAGRNLAFLSANNFFYKVTVRDNTMVGRTTWRGLGKPEASLVGAQYAGWNHGSMPNKPYRLINRQAAPWLFKGTGLRNGATFGSYGIEIDEPNTVSPDDTDVLAEIPHEFGAKAADMTIYRMGRSTVFDAGVFNFGATAHWPRIARMVSNLWSHLSGDKPRSARTARARDIAASLCDRCGRTRPRTTPTTLVATAPKPAVGNGLPPLPPVENDALLWPTYGFNNARTRSVTVPGLNPPFRQMWTFHSGTLLELPPVAGYGLLYEESFDGRLHAIDPATGLERWDYDSGWCGWSSPALGDGLVFATFISNPRCSHRKRGAIIAFAAKTGQIRWSRNVGQSESSPLVSDGTVYFGTTSGFVHALDAATGAERWSYYTGGPVKASPTLDGGNIFVGNYAGNFFALDAGTGALVWEGGGRPRNYFYSSAAVTGGRVYVGAADHHVDAFSEDSGTELWSFPTRNHVYASPAVWNGLVLIGSYDKNFYAIDGATGTLRWSFAAGGPISGAASVINGIVYFSTLRPRKTFALDAATGRVIETWDDGEYSPAVAGDGLLFFVGLGRIYALAPR
ncbi:MAG TPA: N,N-dimethylformamidase beta subunit family domain-containing protein [Gaiellaceae bacterium]|jgi:outer membrane protein assembly factor BamB